MSAEILIIDDNSDIREILNDLIMEAGYATRLAANYNQALSEIDKKFIIDIIRINNYTAINIFDNGIGISRKTTKELIKPS
jgi:DNA-binding NtrC family response regulator